jgi:hypothetical protein
MKGRNSINNMPSNEAGLASVDQLCLQQLLVPTTD